MELVTIQLAEREYARVIAATDQVVEPGETVEVPAALAGRPPAGTPGDDSYDPGEGLLAQADVWQLAGVPATGDSAGITPRSSSPRPRRERE